MQGTKYSSTKFLNIEALKFVSKSMRTVISQARVRAISIQEKNNIPSPAVERQSLGRDGLPAGFLSNNLLLWGGRVWELKSLRRITYAWSRFPACSTQNFHTWKCVQETNTANHAHLLPPSKFYEQVWFRTAHFARRYITETEKSTFSRTFIAPQDHRILLVPQ